MKFKLHILAGIVLLVCISIKGFAQTAGTLTFSYNQPQPTSPALNAGIKNVLAVWIENSTGDFIKTRLRFVGNKTSDHLPTWTVKSGGTTGTADGGPILGSSGAVGVNCNKTDAITGATLTNTAQSTYVAYGSKSVTWDGKNVVGLTNGTTVADGDYKIWIESTWVDSGSNNHQVLSSFLFTKGATTVHLTPTSPSPYFNTVVIDWVPSALGLEDVKYKEPAAVIYPVPSTGIFNLDVKNSLTEIKVINLLGQTIYEEKVKSTADTTKIIDLSKFANGNYVVSLTNEFGTSSYEVILKK